MNAYFLPVRENRIAQEPSSAPSLLHQQVWRKLLGKYFEWTHFGCPENVIETGSSWWWGKSDHTPWQSEVGLSKSDLAGDKLGFMPLSVRPVHSEQSLSTISRYSRGTNGWTSTNFAQIYLSRKLKLWTSYCVPCYRIFTFLVLGVMLTHLVILLLC